jgi:hypothetical protein
MYLVDALRGLVGLLFSRLLVTWLDMLVIQKHGSISSGGNMVNIIINPIQWWIGGTFSFLLASGASLSVGIQ